MGAAGRGCVESIVPDRSCRDGGSPAGTRLVVLIGNARQAFEHVSEVGFRIVAMAEGAFHQDADDRSAPPVVSSPQKPRHIPPGQTQILPAPPI